MRIPNGLVTYDTHSDRAVDILTAGDSQRFHWPQFQPTQRRRTASDASSTPTFSRGDNGDSDPEQASIDTELDPWVIDTVEQRVAWLAWRLYLSSHDADDLRQHVLAECVRGLRRHDPSRGSRRALATGVIKLAIKHWLRLRVSESRLKRRTFSIDEMHPDSSSLSISSASSFEAIDRRYDCEHLLCLLPPKLRAIARQLMWLSVADIARERGVHRGTVHRDVVRIRRVLAAFASDFIPMSPRDTSALRAEGV